MPNHIMVPVDKHPRPNQTLVPTDAATNQDILECCEFCHDNKVESVCYECRKPRGPMHRLPQNDNFCKCFVYVSFHGGRQESKVLAHSVNSWRCKDELCYFVSFLCDRFGWCKCQEQVDDNEHNIRRHLRGHIPRVLVKALKIHHGSKCKLWF